VKGFTKELQFTERTAISEIFSNYHALPTIKILHGVPKDLDGAMKKTLAR